MITILINNAHPWLSQLLRFNSAFSPTVSEYDPYDYLTMRALINLEWGMNIPVLTKLKPYLDILNRILTLKVASVHFCKVPEYQKKCIIGTIEYLKDWVNRKCYRSTTMIPPTWRNFIKILKDISPELNQLVYQIKDLFKGKHHNMH